MENSRHYLPNWLGHLGVSYLIFAIIFEIAFFQDGLMPVVMALKFVVFLQLPGVLLSRYVFEDKFNNAETMIIGTGLGLVVIPFLVYLVNIFEVLHTRLLSYLISIFLTMILSVLGYINSLKKDRIG